MKHSLKADQFLEQRHEEYHLEIEENMKQFKWRYFEENWVYQKGIEFETTTQSNEWEYIQNCNAMNIIKTQNTRKVEK